MMAGSIHDDGSLPEVIIDVLAVKKAMRVFCNRDTTVMAVASQLHSIAVGKLTPGYRVLPQGNVRPVYL